MRSDRALALLRTVRDNDQVSLDAIEGQDLVKRGLVDILSEWELGQRKKEVAELPTLVARQQELMGKVHRLEMELDRSNASLLGKLLGAKGEEGPERDAAAERTSTRQELAAIRSRTLEIMRIQASLARLAYSAATQSAYAINRQGWEVLRDLEALPPEVLGTANLEQVLEWNAAVDAWLEHRITLGSQIHQQLMARLGATVSPTDLRPVAFVLAGLPEPPELTVPRFLDNFQQTSQGDPGMGGLAAAMILTASSSSPDHRPFYEAIRALWSVPMDAAKRTAAAAVLAALPIEQVTPAAGQLASRLMQLLPGDPPLAAALLVQPRPLEQTLEHLGGLNQPLSAIGIDQPATRTSVAAMLTMGTGELQRAIDRFGTLFPQLRQRVDHPEIAAAFAALSPLGPAEVLAHFDRAIRAMARRQVGASPREDASLALLVLQNPAVFAIARGLDPRRIDGAQFPVLSQAFYSSVLLPQHYLKVHYQVQQAAVANYQPSWFWYRAGHSDHVYWGGYRRRWYGSRRGFGYHSHPGHFHGGMG